MRVLAADDEHQMLRVLERCLHGWGYDPVTAGDGLEAWRLLKREDAPSIVILDWDMPGISGLEVCRLLRSTPHGADAYVLMLTARQQKADLIEALESGADDFLSKPFHVRELQLRLAKGISLREAKAAKVAEARGTVAPPSATILGGKYRLEKRIADGGMASVWLGVHLSLGINVAIKLMKPDIAELADYASFEREARAAAQLRNENIVRVYDHGATSDGLPYLVMEYLTGESLWEAVERRGAIPPAEVAAIVEQVARALGEAHARGVVHRDVKPENIVLVPDAERPFGVLAKLVDFGLARPGYPQHDTSAPQVLAGTPSYMSPEHLRGQVPPDPALDLWALAATAFAALTGVTPFDGASVSAIFEAVTVAPLPVPSLVYAPLPTAVDAWFARACARTPSDRYPSAAELASALRAACAEGQPPSAPELPRSAGAPRAIETSKTLEQETMPFAPPSRSAH